MASGVNFGTQQYFGFDPRTIPGCSLWLDGADTRTLTSNVSGKVTQWADKSGAGANMTPVGTQSNATIQTNYRNGLSAVNFAGINVYRTVDNKGVYPSDVYILVALKSITRMDVIAIGTTTTGNFNSLTFAEYSARRWHNGSDFYNRTPNCVSPTDETSTSLLLMNWSLSNNNFVIRRNGTQLVSTATYTYTLTAPSSIQIGFRHTDLTSTTLPLDAYIAEVLTYNRQLVLGERQQVEGYLASKWGLQSNLPASHPYRSVGPIMRAFQPVDVSGGALLWLDAADTTTITGSPVTQWRDKSGRGSNATPGSGSVVAGGTINGLNTLRFGLNNRLYLSNFVMPSAQTSVFYVFKGITGSAVAGTGYFIFSRTVDNFSAFSGNQQFAAYQNPGISRSYIVVMGSGGERTWSNTPTLAFSNATSVVSTTGISYASSNGLSLPLFGTSNVSNTVFTATDYQISTTRSCCGDVYTYDLGELVVCDGTVSIPTAQQMEGYLAWKWGVQSSLPTTHPYYTVLPSTPLFTPAQASGLAFWLDGADTTSMTFSGSTITQWRDKSSNAYAGTPSGSPVQTTTNGLPAVAFNGSTQYFDFGDVADLGAANLNIFCVSKFNSTANGSLFAKSAQAAAAFRYSILREAGSLLTLLESTLGVQGVGTVADMSLATRVLSWIWDRANNTIYQNGSVLGTRAFVNTGTFNSTYKLLVGAYNNSTGTTPPATGFYLDGVICELIFIFGPMNDRQRQQMEGYLAWKWGLQANLPSTHPYAKFRP